MIQEFNRRPGRSGRCVLVKLYAFLFLRFLFLFMRYSAATTDFHNPYHLFCLYTATYKPLSNRAQLSKQWVWRLISILFMPLKFFFDFVHLMVIWGRDQIYMKQMHHALRSKPSFKNIKNHYRPCPVTRKSALQPKKEKFSGLIFQLQRPSS